MRALVIEDNKNNVYLVRLLLEARGHEVLEAPDGPAGIAASRGEAPDVILLDIQLPGMDGYEVARRLREIAHLATVPIVAVTSYAMDGDHARALLAGCDAYIEKPIDPDSFAMRVEEIVATAPRRPGDLP